MQARPSFPYEESVLFFFSFTIFTEFSTKQHKTIFCLLSVFIGYRAAFAVYNPKAASSGRISFQRVLLNQGSHFSINNGKFTCSYAGTYFFLLNLYKAKSATDAYCEIHKNGLYRAGVAALPPSHATDDYHEASNSVVEHLNQGDVINVHCNTGINTLDSMTSFMGFLLYPD